MTNDLAHTERFKQINSDLVAIHKEILDGYHEYGELQEAVYCQVEINRIVYQLNKLMGGE